MCYGMLDNQYQSITQNINLNVLRFHQIDLNQYKMTEIMGDSINNQLKYNQKTVHLDKKLNNDEQSELTEQIRDNRMIE